jgi:hypothetical protein
MLQNMLKDGIDGSWSSKRVITFVAFLLCAIAFVANLFWGYKVESFMFESIIYLVMVGLGVTASEKFAPKSMSNQMLTQSTYYKPINNRSIYGTPLPKQQENEI